MNLANFPDAQREVLGWVRDGKPVPPYRLVSARALERDGYVVRIADATWTADVRYALTDVGQAVFDVDALRVHKVTDFHVGDVVERSSFDFSRVDNRNHHTWERATVRKLGKSRLMLDYADGRKGSGEPWYVRHTSPVKESLTMSDQPALAPEVTRLPLDQIVVDAGTQARAQLDPVTVQDYAEDMQAGDVFPPLTVVYTGATYLLTDGFHRLAAARQIGLADFAVVVQQGDRRAALWASYGGNRANGLPLSNEDKRRVVDAILDDDEWRQRSDHEIHRHTGVSVSFVGSRRKGWEVNHGKQSDVRLGADGRAINTANIGKAAPKVEPSRAVVAIDWDKVGKGAVGIVSAQRERQLADLTPIDRYKRLAVEVGSDALLFVFCRYGAMLLREAAKTAAGLFTPPLATVNTEHGEALLFDALDAPSFFIQPMGLLIPLRRVAAYRDDGWGEFFTHHMLRQLDAERPQEPPKTLTIDVVEPVEPPESPAPVELSAPGRQLTVGDTVRTRTGHVGEVTAINGAHATVWVGSAGAGYETDHLLTSLERVLSTAPPDSLVEPVVTPPAPRPLAVGDRVCSTGPVIVEGVIEVISANRAALRLDNGGMVNRLLGELRRVEGAATVHELQSAPAISRPGVFADLAPLPWTLVKRQILDAKGLPVTSFGLGLDAVAEQVVALINATVGERQPERESI